jgi:hypothetical protein
MSNSKMSHPIWVESLKWAAIVTLIIALYLFGNVVLMGSYDLRIAPIVLYSLGMGLLIVQCQLLGTFSDNLYAACAWSCVADFLIVWLILYIAFRIRSVLRNRRYSKTLQS